MRRYFEGQCKFSRTFINRASKGPTLAQQRKAVTEQELIEIIRAIQIEHRYVLGAPRMVEYLKQKGIHVGRRRVARLMRAADLHCRQQRILKRASKKCAPPSAAPNILNRCFDTQEYNCAWVADMTQIKTTEGKMTLAIVMDLYNREIISYVLAPTENTSMANTALQLAAQKRTIEPNSIIYHSDQGSSYTSIDHNELCVSKLKLIRSMSASGDCYDNAVAESFFATLKSELIAQGPTLDALNLQQSIDHWINYYNVSRIHSSLGGLSPIDFRLKNSSKDAA
jgi:transposase InsO family protein